jgi:hypothetical protein
VLLAAALVGLGGGARPAVADQPVTELGAPVPLVGVDAMVVDAVHGREFVEGSNTPGEPRVVVLSSSGSVLKTIALPEGVSDGLCTEFLK